MALQNTARAKQQSRNTLIIVIVLVLLVLGGAAFFLLGGKSAEPKQNNEVKRPNGTVAVPILRSDINLGQRITQNKLTVAFVKPAEVPTDAILSIKEFLGRLATKNLTAGDYIRNNDFTLQGAHSGYSGIARPGKRIVALPQVIFPSYEALRVGDKIDLLSIAAASAGGRTGGAPLSKTDLRLSATTVQGGGAQPGDVNAGRARRNLVLQSRGAGAGVGNISQGTTATLIAENAEVLSINNNLIVLQMEPQDAHVTTLAIASGASMRVVFRPFNDPTRLTPNPDIKVTTRLPRPSLDPDTITVFNGVDRVNQRAVSSQYRSDGENSVRYVPEDDSGEIEPNVVYLE